MSGDSEVLSKLEELKGKVELFEFGEALPSCHLVRVDNFWS